MTRIKANKLCECGCGACTYLTPHNDRSKSWVKGQPLRFLNGHRSKNAIDITSQRYGRLTVIRRLPNDKNRNARWLCKCDCGIETEALAFCLRSGHTKSCGCLVLESSAAIGRANSVALVRHGHAANRSRNASRTYKTWRSMKDRCTNPKHHAWKHYGGRGIKVCSRWLNSFESFLADMGERPDGLSIDRINNDGNYEPRNCHWATWKQQANNRRNNRPVTA